jgi:hypothetical protein
MRPHDDQDGRPLRSGRRRRLATGSRRSSAVLLVALALTLLVSPAVVAQETDPPPEQPAGEDDECDRLGNALLNNFCRGSDEPGAGPRESPETLTDSLTSSAGDSALRGLTSAVASAGGWMLEEVGTLVTESTSPNVGADWFVTQYQVMLALAVLIALPMLLLSVAQAVVRQDASQALRSAFVYLPLAGLLSFVAPALANLLVALTDWMSLAVSANAASDAQKFMSETGTALTSLGAGTATPAVPVFGVLLGALVTLLGAFSIWIELLLRAAAIYVAVLFLPLSFAAMIWPNTWRWTKRLIEFLVAIIFAKVFIVAIIALAASGLANTGLGSSFEGILASSALLILAAFSPVALLRVIPIAEVSLSQAASQRRALGRPGYAGGILTGSQMVTNMIQSRFRGGSTLGGTSAAASRNDATTATTTGAVAGARAAANGARRRETSVESPAETAPARPRTPRAGLGGRQRNPDPGDSPFSRS